MIKNPKRQAIEMLFGPLFEELQSRGISPIWFSLLFLFVLTLLFLYGFRRRKKYRVPIRHIQRFSFILLIIADVLGIIGAIIHQTLLAQGKGL